MTDLVYPLGTGSQLNDWEIRYSLRSVEKNLSGVGKVFIVGNLPPFLTNVIHLPAEDIHQVPDKNILHKLKIVCNHPDISENFLSLNDDHYLLGVFNAGTFPYHYHGTIDEYIARRGHDTYRLRVGESNKFLKQKGKPNKYFDIHYPILYNKKAFLEIFEQTDPNNKWGYVIKSIYANMMDIEGVPATDAKHDKTPIKSVSVFSTSPRVSAATARFLQEQFPNKSKYEL